jgi:hypothetical protein
MSDEVYGPPRSRAPRPATGEGRGHRHRLGHSHRGPRQVTGPLARGRVGHLPPPGENRGRSELSSPPSRSLREGLRPVLGDVADLLGTTRSSAWGRYASRTAPEER